MLPGFRFLFAAIMLSMSLLIFGLGAASLLRAAHESFASNSSWRGAPEVPFAQRPETTVPMLATLSVDPATDKTNDPAKSATTPADATPSPTESAANDQLAALKPAETQPLEAEKPDGAAMDPVAQNSPAPDPTATPAPAEATINSETRTATIATPEASAAETAPAIIPGEPNAAASAVMAANPVAAPETSIAARKIATLGGPPVEIATEKSITEKKVVRREPKEDRSEVRRRERARRISHRRRLAARARVTAQQFQQQQANPFGQSTVPATR